MKKFALSLMLVSVASVFAGVAEPFVQLGDYDWEVGTQKIKLTVPAESYVYLTNYVLDWSSDPINDLGNVYNMNKNKYGWFSEADINSETGQYSWHKSDGSFAYVTYTNDGYTEGNEEESEKTTKGYFLDYFEESMDIYLVMTAKPFDGGETVDSYQDLHSDDNNTTLAERYVDVDDKDDALAVGNDLNGPETDAAGNHFADFGFVNGGYREFVAVYTKDELDNIEGQTGQPLPGMLFAGLLALGTAAAGKKMRKRS